MEWDAVVTNLELLGVSDCIRAGKVSNLQFTDQTIEA